MKTTKTIPLVLLSLLIYSSSLLSKTIDSTSDRSFELQSAKQVSLKGNSYCPRFVCKLFGLKTERELISCQYTKSKQMGSDISDSDPNYKYFLKITTEKYDTTTNKYTPIKKTRTTQITNGLVSFSADYFYKSNKFASDVVNKNEILEFFNAIVRDDVLSINVTNVHSVTKLEYVSEDEMISQIRSFPEVVSHKIFHLEPRGKLIFHRQHESSDDLMYRITLEYTVSPK